MKRLCFIILSTLIILFCSSWRLPSIWDFEKVNVACAQVYNEFEEEDYQKALALFDKMSSDLVDSPYSLGIILAEPNIIVPIIEFVHDYKPKDLERHITKLGRMVNVGGDFIVQFKNEINNGELGSNFTLQVAHIADKLSGMGYVEEAELFINTCIKVLNAYNIDSESYGLAYEYVGLCCRDYKRYTDALKFGYKAFQIYHDISNRNEQTIESCFDSMMDSYINGTVTLFEDIGSNIVSSRIKDAESIVSEWSNIREEITLNYGIKRWEHLVRKSFEDNDDYMRAFNIGYEEYEYYLYAVLNVIKCQNESILNSWETYISRVTNAECLWESTLELVSLLEQYGLINIIYDILKASEGWFMKNCEYDYAIESMAKNAIIAFNYRRYDLARACLDESVSSVLNQEKPYYISEDSWIQLCVSVAQLYSHDTEIDTYEKILLYIDNYIQLHSNKIKKAGTIFMYALSFSSLLTHKGEYDAAEQCLKNSISFCDEKGFSTTMLKFDLAYIYHKNKEYDDAEKLYIDCIENYNKEYLRNWDKCLAYQYLAYIYRVTKQYDKQHDALRQRFHSSTDYFITSLFTMNSNQRTLFWELNNEFLEGVSGVTVENQTLADIAYDAALFQKGFLLKYYNKIRDNIYSSSDIELIRIYEKYKKAEREKTSNAIELEEMMMKIYSSHSEFLSSEQVICWTDIQKHLKKNDLAVEFTMCYKETTTSYAALLLKPDWNKPVFVELCEESELRNVMNKGVNLYTVNSPAYSLIWKKLEPYFSKGTNIYFAPHGLIHQMNIEILAGSDGKPMNKKCHLYRMSTTANIINSVRGSKYKSATLYGGLNYNTDTTMLVTLNRNYTRTVTSNSPLFCDTIQTRSGWKYLSGTAQEVENIENILDDANVRTVSYTDTKGTEESFKALSGNSTPIIHIATHGFYLEDKNARKEGLFELEYTNDVQAISPLKRSGLIFSGGQHAWLGKEIPAEIEDGVLTAEEIAGMNLTGTDLLVLSACQTGLGEINNEGVVGLQRGFKIAGVNTIIMSLWEVSDAATEVLMTKFYTLLTKGKSKRDAFDKAVESVKKKYPSPEYWAAFIMLD